MSGTFIQCIIKTILQIGAEVFHSDSSVIQVRRNEIFHVNCQIIIVNIFTEF